MNRDKNLFTDSGEISIPADSNIEQPNPSSEAQAAVEAWARWVLRNEHRPQSREVHSVGESTHPSKDDVHTGDPHEHLLEGVHDAPHHLEATDSGTHPARNDRG